MKFWVRFSRNIFRLAADSLLKKTEAKSIESVLKKSIDLLDPEMAEEISAFIKEKQTSEGGFANRSEKTDIYYSLFGYILAEAFSVDINTISFKNYIKAQITGQNLSGVNLYCISILYAKTFGSDNMTLELGRQITSELNNVKDNQKDYQNFMGFLALHYLEDYLALNKLIKLYHGSESQKLLPCPVIAANAILSELSGNHVKSCSSVLRSPISVLPSPVSRLPAFEEELKSFIGSHGGFKALPNAPYEDMLSTGVALYALDFINADLRIIKPDCLSFIDSLYLKGGFRATLADYETDIEYTFYGLLALGSLH